MFRSPAMLLPHESTVAHDHNDKIVPFATTNPSPVNNQAAASTQLTRPVKARLTKRADSQVPNLFANPPQAENHQTHELDDEVEEEEDANSSSSN